MTIPTQAIVWNDSFATGVAEIDEQHMILVHTVNEAAVLAARDDSPDAIERITRDLLSYALYHFETEERLMEEYGYAEGASADAHGHLEAHRAFSARVVATRERLKSGEPVAMDDVIQFLKGWLVNHILTVDKKLGAFIVARRLARSRGASVG